MPGKVSWLDSCLQESTIHITSDNSVTLCGYQFITNFNDRRWTPYRVSKKRGICKRCMQVAKIQRINFKVWSQVISERDITDLPHRCK